MDWEVAGEDKTANKSGAPSPTPPKRKGRKMKKWTIALLVIAVLFVYIKVNSCIKNQPKNLSWPTSGLATMLPDPPTKKGEINEDSDDEFYASIAACSENQYKAYVESCKEAGFTTDASDQTNEYSAYTSDGYNLDLYYYESAEEMSVRLVAPIQMGEITWPTSGSGSYAPTPSSTKGKISSESSDYFTAYVGDTDQAAFSAYVDACIAAGYTVDYHKSDTSFYGDREDGAHMSASYEGFNTMMVKVDLTGLSNSNSAESEAASEPAAQAEEATDTSSDSSDSNGDFRQFVDDYESFMNSYCDFMEKYANSSDTSSMLLDYAKWTKDYAEWAGKFDSYDTSDVSADDLAYYTAAQARVAERISKIQ